jgi:hypothetical protein
MSLGKMLFLNLLYNTFGVNFKEFLDNAGIINED